MDDRSRSKGGGRMLTSSELAAFCLQTSMILKSGIPLHEGLALLKDDVPDPSLQGVLARISDEVAGGSPLLAALESVGVFPAYMVNMVRIGTDAGKLDDVLFGKETELSLKRLEVCDTCGGTGAKKGSSPQTCRRCGGAGQIRIAQGFFSLTTTCDVCGGSGRAISDPCPDCHGQGRRNEKVTIKLNVPRGVETGTQLRMLGEGEAGPVAGGELGRVRIAAARADEQRHQQQSGHVERQKRDGDGAEVLIEELHGRALGRPHEVDQGEKGEVPGETARCRGAHWAGSRRQRPKCMAPGEESRKT